MKCELYVYFFLSLPHGDEGCIGFAVRLNQGFLRKLFGLVEKYDRIKAKALLSLGGDVRMKRETKEKYIYPAVLKGCVVVAGVIVFFIIYRFDQVEQAAGRLLDILMPFVYGGVLAYLLRPVCAFLERGLLRCMEGRVRQNLARKLAGGLSIAGSLTFFLVLTYTLLALVLPQVLESLVYVAKMLPELLNRATLWTEELVGDDVSKQEMIENLSSMLSINLMDWVTSDFMPDVQMILAELSSRVWNIFILAKNILIGLVVCAYLLSGRRRMKKQGKLILLGVFGKEWSDKILEELRFVDSMFVGFINGKLIDSLIIGVLCFAVMNVFNWPLAVLVSTIIGVTNIIPFFGPFIGAVPSALLMLIYGPWQMIYFLVFVLILQQFDGNILGPKILGNTTGLQSFWVLFSITLFGGLFGLAGMVVGVPFFAVLYDLIKKLVIWALKKRKIDV